MSAPTSSEGRDPAAPWVPDALASVLVLVAVPLWIAIAVGCNPQELEADDSSEAFAEGPGSVPAPPRCDHALVASEVERYEHRVPERVMFPGRGSMPLPWLVGSSQAVVTLALDGSRLALRVHDAASGALRAQIEIPPDFDARTQRLDAEGVERVRRAAKGQTDTNGSTTSEYEAAQYRRDWLRLLLLDESEEASLREAGALGVDATPLVAVRPHDASSLPYDLEPRSFVSRCSGCLCSGGMAIERGDHCFVSLAPHDLGEVQLWHDPSEPPAFALLASLAPAADGIFFAAPWLVQLTPGDLPPPIALSNAGP